MQQQNICIAALYLHIIQRWPSMIKINESVGSNSKERGEGVGGKRELTRIYLLYPLMKDIAVLHFVKEGFFKSNFCFLSSNIALYKYFPCCLQIFDHNLY